eukprot:6086062-Ditylum_brightwellii.AAC.1
MQSINGEQAKDSHSFRRSKGKVNGAVMGDSIWQGIFVSTVAVIVARYCIGHGIFSWIWKWLWESWIGLGTGCQDGIADGGMSGSVGFL